MVKVKLNLLNIFQLKTDKKSVEYEGKTVGDVITQFINEHMNELGDEMLSKNKKKFNSQILILLNGRNIKYLKDYKTKLEDSDELYLSFALAGG
ncbi:MAG: MoaD/ThiS family protein [Promethearchaeota archaeon]